MARSNLERAVLVLAIMSATTSESKPEGYLVLSNLSKNHNIGNMVRSACAFGMKEVVSCAGDEL